MFHTAIVPNYYLLNNTSYPMQFPSISSFCLKKKTIFFLIRNLLLQPKYYFVCKSYTKNFLVVSPPNCVFLLEFFLHYTLFFTAHDDFYNYFFSEIVLCICFNWMNFRVYTYYKICYQQRAILNFIVAPSLVVYILL